MAKGRRGIPVDEALKLTASPFRRELLRFLLEEASSWITRDELASHFADEQPRDRTAVQAKLTHSHLPRLADVGVIEYDSESGQVTVNDVATELKPLLDFIDEWGGERS